jgi:hypothetical protein
MDPVADVEVNVPGVMAMLVAPDVVQLSVLLEPELMPVGFAAKEAIAGSEPLVEGEFEEPQWRSPAQERRIRNNKQTWKFVVSNMTEMNLLREQELLVSMNTPHGDNSVYVSYFVIVILDGCSPLGHALYVIHRDFCEIRRSTSGDD